jgi:hypothetical protein
MTRHLLFSILLAVLVAVGETVAAQRVIVTMTPENVDEAIRLAADEKTTARLLTPMVVAVFTLSALMPDSEIRVVFDRTARGFSGLAMCRECTVPVNVNRIR